MKHLKWIVLLMVLSLLCSYDAVLSQGMGGQGPLRPGCQDRFKAMDTDGNGQLSKDEFTSVPHHRGDAEAMFKARDKNGDGVITPDEFCAPSDMGKGMGKGRGN